MRPVRTKKLKQSFMYAIAGLRYAYATQLNMRIHIGAACAAALLLLLLPLSASEVLFVSAAVFTVIICELANTALESVVDLASPNLHPLARIAKDTAAAAVMVSAFFAVTVGLAVFLPAILEILKNGYQLSPSIPSLAAAIVIFAMAAIAGAANKPR